MKPDERVKDIQVPEEFFIIYRGHTTIFTGCLQQKGLKFSIESWR